MPVVSNVSRLLRTAKRIVGLAQSLAQLMLFKARYPLLAGGKKEGDRGEVLFVSLSDWGPRLILEAVIAKAFWLRGYTPVILSYRTYKWAQWYYRCFGIRTMVFLDDLFHEVEDGEAQSVSEELLAQNPTFDDLFRFTWKDVEIGRHVLSTVARQLTQGSVHFEDPEVRRMIRKFLPESIKAAKAAHRLFTEYHPVAVLFLEKGYTPYGVLFDVALHHRLNVVQYHHAHRSDLLMMKRYTAHTRHQHPFSLSSRSWQRIRALKWTEEEEQAFLDELKRSYEEGTWFNRKFLLENKKIKTPEEVRLQLHLDPTKKTAVVFSHVLWDATFFFGKNLFPDYEQWLIATVKAACANPAVNWLVKLHPDYVWKMKHLGQTGSPRDVVALAMNVGELPAHVQIVPPETDISTYSFFPVTDYCITVRGTIGTEAPCFGIPVLTAGTGRYSGLGFTNDSETAEEYLGKLKHIQEIPALTPEETTLARKHAYALFHMRPLQCSTVEMVPKKERSGKFGYRAVLRARTPSGLAQASDLKNFTDWVLHAKDEDYLRLPATHDTRASA